MIRDLLRAVTPPIVPQLARRMGFLPRTDFNCDGVFSSFDRAAEAARSGYHMDDAITAIVKAKSTLLRAMVATYPITVTLPLFTRIAETVGLALGRSTDRIRVLDFGGALGTAYFVADAIARTRIWSWTVVEIPEICLEAGEFDTTIMRHVSTLDAAGAADLVYTDGCLQFVPHTLETLAALGELMSPMFCVRRMALTEEATFWTVLRSTLRRHSPEGVWDDSLTDLPISLPMAVFNRQEFEETLETRHEVRMQLAEPRGAYRAKDWSADMFGYFCLRR